MNKNKKRMRVSKPFSLILKTSEPNKMCRSTYGIYTLSYLYEELFLKESIDAKLWIRGPKGDNLLEMRIFNKEHCLNISAYGELNFIVEISLNRVYSRYAISSGSDTQVYIAVPSWHEVDALIEEMIKMLKLFQYGTIF